MGDIVFYTDQHGNHLARRRGGPSAERIRTDPAFERARENGSEFGTASGMAKKIRTAFALHFPQRPADGYIQGVSLHNRLVRELLQLIRHDLAHPRGQRQLSAATLPLLAGFEWSGKGAARRTLVPQEQIASGNLHITVAAPGVPHDTVVKLTIACLPDAGAAPVVTAVAEESYHYTGPLVLQVPLPSSGLWIAAIGYRVPNRQEYGMCIVAAGGV
jgi:hypothetical protein